MALAEAIMDRKFHISTKDLTQIPGAFFIMRKEKHEMSRLVIM